MKNTPQTKIVYTAIQKLGHATNRELHNAVMNEMPDLSLTSVHRITKRLVDEGYAQCTQTAKGVSVVDARTDIHSHFNCESCDGIVDIDLSEHIVDQIQEQLGENIAGVLTMTGSCAACVDHHLVNNMKAKINTKELV